MALRDSRQHSSLSQVRRTLLFLDVVESTRLLEIDERGMVLRWRRFVDLVESKILPRYEGRIVKSLGDGLLIDFFSVQRGASAALAIQAARKAENEDLPVDKRILLRMGMEVSDLLVDDHDVYGRGAMLGARLMTLAGPSECVVSENIRDDLGPALQTQLEDLGECYLKHCAEPVRAFRLGPPGHHPVVEQGLANHHLIPSIAVVPFEGRNVDGDQNVIGEILAEEIIQTISRSEMLDVISRLSTRCFSGNDWSPQDLRVQLQVDYVLAGVFRLQGHDVVLDAELVETRSDRLIWGQRVSEPIEDVLNGEQEVVWRIVSDLSSSILTHELKRGRTQALPTLESYSLLMSGINLMHSMSHEDFTLSYKMLRTVSERATRHSVPKAWLAKWYVLNKQQGWSVDPESDSRNAIDECRSALDADPESSLALAIDGLVCTHMKKDVDKGFERYEKAITVNPNDSLAWLLKGALHAFKGEGRTAVNNTQRAIALSPLDPHSYYFQSLAATAFLASEQYDLALEYAQRSLRANPAHTSTIRAKAVAEWQLGYSSNARRTAQQLMELEPNFTVSGWLERSPSAPYAIGGEWAKSMRDIGLPS